jgi:hypothetical protein
VVSPGVAALVQPLPDLVARVVDADAEPTGRATSAIAVAVAVAVDRSMVSTRDLMGFSISRWDQGNVKPRWWDVGNLRPDKG